MNHTVGTDGLRLIGCLHRDLYLIDLIKLRISSGRILEFFLHQIRNCGIAILRKQCTKLIIKLFNCLIHGCLILRINGSCSLAHRYRNRNRLLASGRRIIRNDILIPFGLYCIPIGFKLRQLVSAVCICLHLYPFCISGPVILFFSFDLAGRVCDRLLAVHRLKANEIRTDILLQLNRNHFILTWGKAAVYGLIVRTLHGIIIGCTVV